MDHAEYNQRLGSWMSTYTGRKVWPLMPSPNDIAIEDIAHALSRTCRFCGHTVEFYSVAQHSIEVSYVVPPEAALWGLLHDAAEAYLCDLPKPVKSDPSMAAYREAEDRFLAAVACRFGLTPTMPASVKVADTRMLVTEATQLLAHRVDDWHTKMGVDAFDCLSLTPLGPDQAEAAFLQRFVELSIPGHSISKG